MRIGICGVASTGKSTLAKAVAERSGMKLVWEQDILDEARRRFDADFGSAHILPAKVSDFTPLENLQYERKFLEVEYEMEQKYAEFITDRSPLDTMNWMMTLCCGVMPVDEFQQHMKQLLRVLRTFDVIWYLPFGVLPTVDDNRRHTDYNLLFMMDCILRGLISKYEDCGPQFFDMTTTDLESRISAVTKDIPADLPLLHLFPGEGE